MRTIALLTISNIFMTFAWYGHLKFREVPLYKVVIVSWLIAFFEYCFQVPANRIGSYEFSAAQLKTIQEVITLTVFAAASLTGVFTDLGNQRIRKIYGGTITTVAGNGAMGFCGDGGPSTSACLSSPAGIAIDTSGNLFIADTGNQRIRQVNSFGTITTVAGNGTAGFCGDGGAATDACLNGPTGIDVDKNDLFIVDQQNNRIRRVH